MNFKNISDDEYRRGLLVNDLSFFVNLSTKKKKEYLKLYSLYRKYFTEYMNQILQLKKYDDELMMSNLNFRCIDEDEMDLYQWFSCGNLKFFYYRNNIYIERLTDKERHLLLTRLESGNYDYDEEIREMIAATFERMIFEDVARDGSICYTVYGTTSQRYLSKNNSIIIGFHYDEYFHENMSDEDWLVQNTMQSNYYRELEDRMYNSWNGKFNVPIKIMKYEDVSVKPIKLFKNEFSDSEYDYR